MDIQMKKQNKQSFTYGYVTYYMDESMDLFLLLTCKWFRPKYVWFWLQNKLYYNKYIIIVNIATFPVFEILKIWSIHIFDGEMKPSQLGCQFCI